MCATILVWRLTCSRSNSIEAKNVWLMCAQVVSFIWKHISTSPLNLSKCFKEIEERGKKTTTTTTSTMYYASIHQFRAPSWFHSIIIVNFLTLNPSIYNIYKRYKRVYVSLWVVFILKLFISSLKHPSISISDFKSTNLFKIKTGSIQCNLDISFAFYFEFNLFEFLKSTEILWF